MHMYCIFIYITLLNITKEFSNKENILIWNSLYHTETTEIFNQINHSITKCNGFFFDDIG